MTHIYEIAKRITKSKTFNNFIFILILLAAILAGIETYQETASKYLHLIILLDKFIITFFALEIGLKILAMEKKPWRFFSDPWNVFDFLIVVVCLIPVADTHFYAVLRILRVLRVLRMITFLPKLRLLIGTLLKSIPSMGYVTLLLFILFYVYAIIGVFIFQNSDPIHFGDLHHALITLFKVLTLEGWTDIMNTHIYGKITDENVQIIAFWPFFYFASFILIGAMIIMNLFIGVIMSSMEESQNELAMELQKMNVKDKNTDDRYKLILARLDELRTEIVNLEKMKDDPGRNM